MKRRSHHSRKNRKLATVYTRSIIYDKMVFLDNLKNGSFIYGEIIKPAKITSNADFIRFISSLKNTEKFAPIKIVTNKKLFKLKNYEDFMQYAMEYSPHTVDNATVFTNFTELYVYKVKIINEHK